MVNSKLGESLLPPRPSWWAQLASKWPSWLLLLGMAGLCWWIGAQMAHGYRWQWYRVWNLLGTWDTGTFRPGPLFFGLLTTLKLTGCSLVFAVAAGGLLAGMRLSPSPPARALASGCIGLIRNTPLLMQLFMVYFVIAPILGLGQFAAAVCALGLFEGCYIAEIFRGGMASIPKSQWEAALSQGMTVTMASRLIIVPQVLRKIVAPLVNQIVSLIKDTSLVSAIAVADLTMQARVAISETFLSFELWLLTAAIYLCLTLLVSIPARWLEHVHPQTS